MTHERSREVNDSQHRTTRRILVVANETAEGAALHEAIRARAQGNEPELLVVAPALNSRPRRWTSAEDEAFAAAETRLRRCLDLLEWAGLEANGVVADADPLNAIAEIDSHDPGRVPGALKGGAPASLPPSMTSVVPVTNEAWSEHSQTAAEATSVGRPIRRIGIASAALRCASSPAA